MSWIKTNGNVTVTMIMFMTFTIIMIMTVTKAMTMIMIMNRTFKNGNRTIIETLKDAEGTLDA